MLKNLQRLVRCGKQSSTLAASGCETMSALIGKIPSHKVEIVCRVLAVGPSAPLCKVMIMTIANRPVQE
jgi:hypothetical protein